MNQSNKFRVLLVAPGSNLESCDLLVQGGQWPNCEIKIITKVDSSEFTALEADISRVGQKGYVAIVFDLTRLNLVNKLRVFDFIADVHEAFPAILQVTYKIRSTSHRDLFKEQRSFLAQCFSLDDVKRTVRALLEKLQRK